MMGASNSNAIEDSLLIGLAKTGRSECLEMFKMREEFFMSGNLSDGYISTFLQYIISSGNIDLINWIVGLTLEHEDGKFSREVKNQMLRPHSSPKIQEAAVNFLIEGLKGENRREYYFINPQEVDGLFSKLLEIRSTSEKMFFELNCSYLEILTNAAKEENVPELISIFRTDARPQVKGLMAFILCKFFDCQDARNIVREVLEKQNEIFCFMNKCSNVLGLVADPSRKTAKSIEAEIEDSRQRLADSIFQRFSEDTEEPLFEEV